MAEGKQTKGGGTKAERRRAKAGGEAKAAGKQATGEGKTKAERRQAKAGRKESAAPTVEDGPSQGAEEGLSTELIESHLARIEDAVVAQAQRTEELLEKLDALIGDAGESG